MDNYYRETLLIWREICVRFGSPYLVSSCELLESFKWRLPSLILGLHHQVAWATPIPIPAELYSPKFHSFHLHFHFQSVVIEFFSVLHLSTDYFVLHVLFLLFVRYFVFLIQFCLVILFHGCLQGDSTLIEFGTSFWTAMSPLMIP